jgi:membrane protein
LQSHSRGNHTGVKHRTRDAWDVLRRAVAGSREDKIGLIARALAFSLFLAIPAIFLVLLGLFSLIADERDIAELMDRAGQVMPQEAVTLLESSLDRTAKSSGGGLLLTIVGFALALWTTTSAATTLMDALTQAYDLEDDRSFVRKRLIGLAIVLALAAAAALILGLLVLGPHLEGWIGSAADAPRLTAWLWWTAQWPILVGGLLFAFALVLYLAPDVEQPRWQLVTPGAVTALVMWLVASGAFAVYAASFGSYNKTWGTLSAVIVTLLWLWITSLALLFGAEVNAEARRLAGASAAEDARNGARRFPPDGSGNPTGMDTDRIEGKKKELEGKGQQKWADAKDAAKDKWEDVKDKAEDVGDETEDRWDERDEREEDAARSSTR